MVPVAVMHRSRCWMLPSWVSENSWKHKNHSLRCDPLSVPKVMFNRSRSILGQRELLKAQKSQSEVWPTVSTQGHVQQVKVHPGSVRTPESTKITVWGVTHCQYPRSCSTGQGPSWVSENSRKQKNHSLRCDPLSVPKVMFNRSRSILGQWELQKAQKSQPQSPVRFAYLFFQAILGMKLTYSANVLAWNSKKKEGLWTAKYQQSNTKKNTHKCILFKSNVFIKPGSDKWNVLNTRPDQSATWTEDNPIRVTSHWN